MKKFQIRSVHDNCTDAEKEKNLGLVKFKREGESEEELAHGEIRGKERGRAASHDLEN